MEELQKWYETRVSDIVSTYRKNLKECDQGSEKKTLWDNGINRGEPLDKDMSLDPPQ